MSKFKVGDKIIVVKCLNYLTGECEYDTSMDPYIENKKIGTIVKVLQEDFDISEKGHKFIYTVQMPDRNEPFEWFCNDELREAKITNWRKRLK